MSLVEWITPDKMYHCGTLDDQELMALWDDRQIDIISVEIL